MAHDDFQGKVHAAIDAVKGRTLPGTANTVSLVLIAWGVLAFGFGLATDRAAWTWGALLVAAFYGICFAQGGLMFSVIMHGTFARWGRPLKRAAEAFAILLPVAWLLLIVFLVGGIDIYPWSPDWVHGEPVALEPHGPGAAAAKPWWLTKGFFVARQIAGVALLMLLDFVLIRSSLVPDLVLAKQRLGADAPAWWDRLIAGKSDVDALADKAAYTGQVMTPIMGFAYAILMSLLSFDLIMSLDPWWFSNMFGGWIFMSSLLMGLCGLAVVATLARDWLGLGAWIKPNVTHDLGKLMLAATMFWAYTLFAQILPIYYTDVPEETNFLLVRMVLPQWGWLARVVAVLCFVAPFTILLSRGIKKMRWPFLGVAVISLFGVFLERSLLVMPSVHLGDTFPTVDFLIINLGLGALVVGLAVQVIGRFLAQVPAVPVADPLLEDHPWDVHVHALGTHGGH